MSLPVDDPSHSVLSLQRLPYDHSLPPPRPTFVLLYLPSLVPLLPFPPHPAAIPFSSIPVTLNIFAPLSLSHSCDRASVQVHSTWVLCTCHRGRSRTAWQLAPVEAQTALGPAWLSSHPLQRHCQAFLADTRPLFKKSKAVRP